MDVTQPSTLADGADPSVGGAPAHAVEILAMLDRSSIHETWRQRPSALEQLLKTWPDGCHLILEWALINPGTISTISNRQWLDTHRFVIQALGEVGTPATVELLRVHVLDPDVGTVAVATIRQIQDRHS